jgi:ankyrin repeat protein
MLRTILSCAIWAVVLTATIAGDERLADAARRADAAAVRTLLDRGAAVNDAMGDGMTALHWAAYNDDVEMARLLLGRGASVDAVTRNGNLTPLMVAATNGNAAVMAPLLDSRADTRARSTDGATVLMMGALSGSVAVVTRLLDHGAEIDAKDSARGQTPLMFAAAADRVDVLKLLASRGAGVRLTSTVSPPPRLVRVGGNPNAPQQAPPKPTDSVSQARAERRVGPSMLGGWAALHFAAREGHIAAARALIDAGADVNQANDGDRTTPLLTAIVNGHYDLAKLLIEKGADPNRANDDGLAPLYATIDMQFAPVIWQPNPPTDQEHTTHLELMALLLERGADPNARLKRKLWFRPSDHDDAWTGTAGTTAFWRAAFATDVAAMRLLVSKGADPQIESSEGVTPLMAAAGLGWTGNQHRTVPDSWLPAVKYCLELGAELNARDIFGYSTLHAAAYRGDNELVKFLVEKGARLDAVTIFGDNVTDMANAFVAFGSLPQEHPDTVKLLIGLGAPSPRPQERKYCTAADLNCPVVAARR